MREINAMILLYVARAAKSDGLLRTPGKTGPPFPCPPLQTYRGLPDDCERG